ncbi:inactive transglutaminase family protein [Shimia sp. Alg240-R146]|uniref:inactive transglutaminase family protein n=1 Tax=Shimia sp. Alg240-R146 TaxID=2993449 RepID=UPI0022E4BC66|nr:inactive transglutaminase family protein [Shimia sp. Alg240-R146]
MTAKLQLRIIVGILLFVGVGLTAFKHLELGFPLLPGTKETVWTAEAHVSFRATGEPVRVTLSLPVNTNNLLVVDHSTAGRGFGFHIEEEGRARKGVWQTRNPSGEYSLYYRARVYRGGLPDLINALDAPASPEKPVFSQAEGESADSILAEAYEFSADNEGLALRLVQSLTAQEPTPAVLALIGENPSRHVRVNAALRLMHSAGIPAERVRGILLEERKNSSRLTDLLAIWNGEGWHVIDFDNAQVGLPELFLPWQFGGDALYEIEGGVDSSIRFSVIADQISGRHAAVTYNTEIGSSLIDFSILSLPVEAQNAFATLLLIPIGALVVVVLRNIVGLRTSGTFMPILIALVFVQTELLTGLVLFLIVVSSGLVIRGYLTSLNLLLVPRIAAVLVVVITLYIALSVIGFRLGISEALSVTFFPMIIISWTIERMSVLVEEEGMKEVFLQGGGSLLTAVIAYLVMTNRYISYWTFEFPELLLVGLAIILVIGQYTGYRLSELRRFEPLARKD